MERAADARTTMRIFAAIDRELSVIKWMMALQLAASIAVLILPLEAGARL